MRACLPGSIRSEDHGNYQQDQPPGWVTAPGAVDDFSTLRSPADYHAP